MGKKWCLAYTSYNCGNKLTKSDWNYSPSWLPHFPHTLFFPSLSHNDLPLQLRILHNNRLSQIDLHNISKVATDITRLQAGHVQGQVLWFISLSFLMLLWSEVRITPESSLVKTHIGFISSVKRSHFEPDGTCCGKFKTWPQILNCLFCSVWHPCPYVRCFQSMWCVGPRTRMSWGSLWSK